MTQAARKFVARQAPPMLQLLLPDLEQIRALLHDLVVDSGLKVLGAMLEEDRERLCGPRYARTAGRDAYRFGHAPGELALGGRRVQVQRPRVRGRDGEVALPTWEHFSRMDPLGTRAEEQMLVGVSTRKYRRSLEPLPEGVVERGTSKSAVSRQFVSRTQAQLDEWLERDLSKLRLCALLIDGLAISEHAVLTAAGIDEGGHKHVLGVHEGATENATACTALLNSLRDRKLDLERPMLIVIDGAKALRTAVRNVFGNRCPVQRCQVHKMRNVTDHLPERERPRVAARMREAYRSIAAAMRRGRSGS